MILAAMVFVLPNVMVPDDVSPLASRVVELRNSVRGTLIQLAGGALLVIGVVATWRQLHINRESQITDRYTRAVEQLGAGTVDVQLGGLYALERTTHDSPHDRPTIAEVLTAFVRHRAKPLPESARDRDDSAESESEQNHDGSAERLQTQLPAAQAAMRALGRMPRPAAVHLDLAKVDLRGADLQGANLANATLSGANLARANLQGANLTDVNLQGATLTRANLLSANLTGGHLSDAILTRANLGFADLTDSQLSGANLTDVNLSDATLTRASLLNANLTRARLPSATLTRASLGGPP